MLLTGPVQSELAISEVAMQRFSEPAAAPQARRMAARLSYDALAAGSRFEVSSLELGQLCWAARRALADVASGPVARRILAFEDRAVILLAARTTQVRRAPPDPGLIRLTLELGTGLQLRTIGRLAIVAIELPYVREASA
jgi:hypothetical protein